jgi:uncharacterized integral membrane protein (TIGR00698 family)
MPAPGWKAPAPIPGLALAAALALVATALARWVGTDLLGYARSPLSPVLVTVLLGVAIRNGVGLAPAFEPGLRLCVRHILRVSVALLGIRLSLAAAGATGLAALPVVLATITAAIVVVTGLTRVFRLPRRLGTLIAVGTSICGITAIVATSPVIGAEEDETSYAVGTIALFGMAALLVHPFLAHLLFGDPHRAGIFLGTAIHDTSQVAGAGLAYAQQFGAPAALETATVTKLIRNLCMVAVIPLMGVLYRRGGDASGPAGPTTGAPAGDGTRPVPRILEMVPLFVIGFLAMTALRTIGDLGDRPFGVLDPAAWAAFVGAAETASELGLLLAMAAVGLGTDLRRMRALGLRPLAMGLAAAATVGVVSYLMIVGTGV